MTMRESFQQQLDRLEALLIEEADLVMSSLPRAMEVLRTGNLELADEVIADDDHIDLRYITVERGIEALLARQTPVAIDLRLVLAMLHINLSLERMGDYCVTIAKLAKLAHRLEGDDDLVDTFDEMAQQADRMIRVAISAFLARDDGRALELVEMDNLIDRANRKAVQRLLDLGSAPDAREWGLRMILVSRALERIGDHAVDIGEQTVYLVTGEFREFTDASTDVTGG